MATIHGVICYISPVTSLKPFSGPRRPVHTPLLAHVYGIANILMGAIRVQAAYDVSNKVGHSSLSRHFSVDPTVQALYDLALGTYVGVIWLLVSEMMVWKTVHVKDIIVPFAVTAVGLGWMARQREWYVG